MLHKNFKLFKIFVSTRDKEKQEKKFKGMKRKPEPRNNK
jgi:hypothetical protein